MSARAIVATVIALAALGGCGDATERDCDEAERQVTDCLDRYCDQDSAGAFCGCYMVGEHLDTTSGCDCADGTVWSQMEAGVCDELEGAPQVDCNGLEATVRRFETFGGCS